MPVIILVVQTSLNNLTLLMKRPKLTIAHLRVANTFYQTIIPIIIAHKFLFIHLLVNPPIDSINPEPLC